MISVLKRWVRNIWVAAQLLLRIVGLPVAVFVLVASLIGIPLLAASPMAEFFAITLMPLTLLLAHDGFRLVIDLIKAIGLLYAEDVALSEQAVLSLKMLRRSSYAIALVCMLFSIIKALLVSVENSVDVLRLHYSFIPFSPLYAVFICEWIIHPILVRNQLAVLRGSQKNLEHSSD